MSHQISASSIAAGASLFSVTQWPLHRVGPPAAGGATSTRQRPRAVREEAHHRWPERTAADESFRRAPVPRRVLCTSAQIRQGRGAQDGASPRGWQSGGRTGSIAVPAHGLGRGEGGRGRRRAQDGGSSRRGWAAAVRQGARGALAATAAGLWRWAEMRGG